MRAGITDIVSPGSDAAQLRVVLERASHSFASRHRTLAPQQITESNKA
jgi:pilus assembly protein CpaE